MALENWRMVSAAPGITPEQAAEITANIEKMVQSPEWKETLERNNWQDTFLAGDAFKQQLAVDTQNTREILTKIGLVK